MARIETWLECDLEKMVQVVPLRGNVFTADDEANLIGVSVKKAGQDVALTGGCNGYVIRQDGYTVAIAGTISGNKASIILPASCYVVPGRIDIVIKNGTTTLAACSGIVTRTTTDAIVDPGHLIPSIEELLAKIADCEAATTAATSAASNANTKAALADEKATLANTKAALADEKATAANTAAGTANTAAAKINDMTVAASGLAAGASPTATVSDVSGHKHIAFGIPKGDTGAVPNISIGTVTTVQPDQPASVTRRSGSPDTAPIFDFSLPKGETGSVENVYGTTIEMSSSDSTKIATAIGAKADKVQSATSGDFAGLDANGNLTDSGYDPSDFAGATATEQSLAALADGMAIVAEGDTHIAITSGQFVYVRNHSTLAQGLYKATSNIAADGALSSSNLTADSTGGLNALNEQMANLNGKIKSWAVTGTAFKALASGSSVSVSVNVDEYIGFGLVFFYVAHCGGSSITSNNPHWTVSGSPLDPLRNQINVPIAKTWDNSNCTVQTIWAQNAGTYTYSFTNYTGSTTDASYYSHVKVVVVKLL